MKLYSGLKVRVRKYSYRPLGWNGNGEMDEWMGKVVTIACVGEHITIVENVRWVWDEDNFEPVNPNVWKGKRR